LKAAPFAFHPAVSVDHAVDLLASFAPEGGRLIAGGQSLVPIMAFRLAQPPYLIDINTIPDLDRMTMDGGMVRIPAGVRHAALARAPGPAGFAALLAQVCRHIAHVPIRARGTFCGSLAHADPSSEWCLVFRTFGGTALARSVAGGREIAAETFFEGIMTTALAADEMLVEARLAAPPADTRTGFYEVSRRAGDYAMAMALVAYRLADGRIASPRVGLGGVEAAPRRLAAAEAELDGSVPSDAVFARAAEAAAAAIEPMEDPQTSAPFRRDLARAVTLRALARSRLS
jgi:carbon-monoxide dehydrogenase medium subunit